MKNSIKQLSKERVKFYYEILKALPITFLEIPKDVFSSVHLAIIRLKKISPEYYQKN